MRRDGGEPDHHGGEAQPAGGPVEAACGNEDQPGEQQDTEQEDSDRSGHTHAEARFLFGPAGHRGTPHVGVYSAPKICEFECDSL